MARRLVTLRNYAWVARRRATTLTIALSAGQLEDYSKAVAAHGLPVD
ncbi:hypothetical protein [Streptomyces umbrinus]